MGGGGGCGVVLYNSAYSIDDTASAISLRVGQGGIGAPAAGTNGQPGGHAYTINATAGASSQFGSLIALGGGYGGSSNFNYPPLYG